MTRTSFPEHPKAVKPKDQLKRSTQLLLAFSFSIFLLLAVTFILNLVAQSQEQETSRNVATLVNLVSRQRMLGQCICKDLMIVKQSDSPVELEAATIELRRSLDDFIAGGQCVADTLAINEVFAGNSQIRQLIDEVQAHSSRIQTAAKEALFRAPDQALDASVALHAVDPMIACLDRLNESIKAELLSRQEYEHLKQTGLEVIGLMGVGFIVFAVCLPTIRTIREQQDVLFRQAAELHRLSLVAERTSNAVIITDAARRIIWVNEGFTRITGYHSHEVQGVNPGSLLQCEETDPDTVRSMRDLLDAGRPVRTEIINRHKNGSLYWLDLDIQPIHDSAGQLTGFVAVEIDVTERKNSEQRIQAQREELRATLQSIGDGVISTDAQGCITNMNPIAEQLTGWSLEDAIGRPIGDVFAIIHSQTREPVDNPVFEVLSRGQTVELAKHVILIAREGTERHIGDSCAPIRRPDGSLAGTILVFRDISREYLSQMAVQASEENLRSLMNCAPMMVWTSAPTGECESFNQQWLDFRGRDLEQERGLGWLEGVHPDDRAECVRLYKVGPECQLAFEAEYRLQRWDGEYRRILARRAPRRSSSGEFLGFVAAAMDITEQREAELRVQELAERTELALAGGNLGLWDWNLCSGIAVYDARWADMLGLCVADLEPTMDTLFSRIHPEDLPAVRECLEKHLSHESSEYRIVYRMRHQSGDWIWIQASGRVVSWSDCQTAERMVGTHMDVTEQVLQREQIATARDQAEKALRETETLLRSLNEFGIISITDSKGKIIDVNEGFCRISGYDREDLIGRDHRMINSGNHSKAFWKEVWKTIHSGKTWRGEVCNRSKQGHLYWVDSTIIPFVDPSGRIEKYVSIRFDITERKLAEQRLRIAAHTDRLTGLPNRTELLERVEHVVHRSKIDPNYHYGILFLDFDRFKFINDSLGHEVGDLLLKKIASRLQRSLRQTDVIGQIDNRSTPARLGGDEFVVLLDGIRHPEEASRVADRLLKVLASPYNLNGHRVNSTASIGIVTSWNRHGSADDAIRDADTALYEAKARGKGCYVVFDETMRKRVQERMVIENELRTAIANRQLIVEYQPIICLRTGHMESAEGLVRWRHPQLGLVPPSKFIPIAEETRLVSAIGEFVLRTACHQFMEWRRILGNKAPSSISVNLSRLQLCDSRLGEKVAEILAETGMDPEQLYLEVTESEIMSNPKESFAVMEGLRALGVKIELDDFGTGYSALSCLHEFPIDVLKIDRAFITDILHSQHRRTLVQGIVQLSKNLGIRVVAEGIETHEQMVFLQSLDCDYGQGYLFSRPCSAAEFALLPNPVPDVEARLVSYETNVAGIGVEF